MTTLFMSHLIVANLAQMDLQLRYGNGMVRWINQRFLLPFWYLEWSRIKDVILL